VDDAAAHCELIIAGAADDGAVDLAAGNLDDVVAVAEVDGDPVAGVDVATIPNGDVGVRAQDAGAGCGCDGSAVDDERAPCRFVRPDAPRVGAADVDRPAIDQRAVRSARVETEGARSGRGDGALIGERAPVSRGGNALIRCVLIAPWLSTVLSLTTPIARTPVLKMEPGNTVTLTLVLLPAAEMGVVLGFGAAVSQTTVSFEVG